MENNSILRSLRYTFKLNDAKMLKVFSQAGHEVTSQQISKWLKKDDEAGYEPIYDNDLAYFLNGFIIEKRGQKDDKIPVAEKRLTNNIVLRKIKIALNLKDEDMLEILGLVDFKISKHELSAFFRKPTQSQFRPCKDQILRYILQGLTKKYRPEL
jgi:uncharacterized protein YehS (DUF1456 family)